MLAVLVAAVAPEAQLRAFEVQASGALLGADVQARQSQQAFLSAERALHLEDTTRAEGLHTCSCVTPEDEARQDLKRMRWLHFPKTGTSFWATLYGYACREKGPIDLNVSPILAKDGCHSCYDFAVMDRYPPQEYCPADAFQSLEPNGYCYSGQCPETQHRPLGRHGIAAHDDPAHAVAMFRNPQDRLMSAAANRHMSGFGRDEIEAVQEHCGHDLGGNPACFASFPGIQGCMTRMLIGGMCADGEHSRDPVAAKAAGRKQSSDPFPLNVSKAIAVLEQLAFVGLTEEWNDSVCLFHKMFGGKVEQSEFKNFHKSPPRQASEHVEDPADAQVYAAAKARFAKLKAEHGAEQCYALQPTAACQPRTCEDQAVECMGSDDGCGGPLDCGHCSQHRGFPAECKGGKCDTGRPHPDGTFNVFSYHG